MGANVEIKPEMIRWAIVRSGKDFDMYLAEHPMIGAWYRGEKLPTIRQLDDFAKSVYVPFGYLFLPVPPQESYPIPLFRGNANVHGMDLNVYDTVLMIQYRQDWLEDYLKTNEFEPCRYVNVLSRMDSEDVALDKLHQILNLSLDWALGVKTSAEAVNVLVDRIESMGIYVVKNGVVGVNNNRRIKVEECRGFALIGVYAPFIFVNNADSKSAQLFTLIHELMHILLGRSAGYGGYEESKNVDERYCDRVAADFLVPTLLLPSKIGSDFLKDIKDLVRKFKVSEFVIARKLKDLQLISYKQYQEFWHYYINRPKESKRGSGGNYYATSRGRLGRNFAVHVNNALNSGQLSYVEASRLTGMSDNAFKELIRRGL